MVERGAYPGNINTSDGLTKSLSIVNLGNLIDRDMFRISPEERKQEIRRKHTHRDTTFCITQQLRGERIWTLTCDAGRARSGVGKLWRNCLCPIIHFFAQNEVAKQKPISKGRKVGRPSVFT